MNTKIYISRSYRMVINLYLLLAITVLLLCKHVVAECREPTSGTTSNRFSITLWSNVTDGAVYTTPSMNVTVASGNPNTTQAILVKVPGHQQLNFSFPIAVFPGALTLSFYRFTWSAYALNKTCDGFLEVSISTTVTPFTFEYEDQIVDVPARVPVIDDFGACTEETVYSLNQTFTVDSVLFPASPKHFQGWLSPGKLQFSNTSTVLSMCTIPRRTMHFVVATNITSAVRVGELRTLQIEGGAAENGTIYSGTNQLGDAVVTAVDDTDESTITEVTFQTRLTTLPYTTGVDYLYLPRALLIVHIVPSIRPVSETIMTSNQSVSVELAFTSYVSTFGHYFRDQTGNIILPGQSVTIPNVKDTTKYTFSLEEPCKDYKQYGTITLIRPSPITIESGKHVPGSTTANSFNLGRVVNVKGDPGETLLLRVSTSKGQMTVAPTSTAGVCTTWCDKLSYVGDAPQIKALLSATRVVVPPMTSLIGDYDGVRVEINDTAGYVRYAKSLNTDQAAADKAARAKANADMHWVVIYSWTVFAVSMTLVVIGMAVVCKNRAMLTARRASGMLSDATPIAARGYGGIRNG